MGGEGERDGEVGVTGAANKGGVIPCSSGTRIPVKVREN